MRLLAVCGFEGSVISLECVVLSLESGVRSLEGEHLLVLCAAVGGVRLRGVVEGLGCALDFILGEGELLLERIELELLGVS